MPFIILGIVAIVVISFIAYTYYVAQKRQKALMLLADNLGLEYSYIDLNGKDLVYSNISLFQSGHSKEASNVISGDKEGCSVDIFDYKYVTGSGKNSITHHNSVCILTIPQTFKYLFIRTENFLDKIAAVIGFDYIHFESKEFSSRFYVKSNDKKFAYDIIHPEMMDFMLNYHRIYNNMPFIEINERHLACYYQGSISPERYGHLYNFAWEFYKKIPHYVLEEYAM